MHRTIRVVKGIVLFALYVWLCRKVYWINAVDSCLDAGGVWEAAARACSESLDLGARATYWFWVVLLGGPAVLIYAIDKVLASVIARIMPQPPNNALEQTREG